MTSRTRYLVCGLSARGLASFVLPILGLRAGGADGGLGFGSDEDDLSAHAEVIGIVDTDQRRVAEFNTALQALGRPAIPFVPDGDLTDALTRLRPDALIVTSPDHTHAHYILAALAAGIDVITEKPITSTAAAAAEVLAAEAESAGTVRVSHNFRYPAAHRAVRGLIADGRIGRVTRVSMDYHVDLRHGASYFLRWNRQRALSGGLSVHKSCHHFDLINWWIGASPQEIFGYGALNYYGPQSPHKAPREQDSYFLAQRQAGVFPEDDDRGRPGLFGLHYPGQYPATRPLYLYDDDIDVEDTYSAVAQYSNGASLAYSVDFSSTWEGYRVSIAGTDGSIDLRHGRSIEGTPLPDSDTITLAPLFGVPQQLPVNAEAGGHGGADPLMRQDLFVSPSAESVRLGLMASTREAAAAVAMGEGLWRSIVEHRPMNIAALLA